jgi:ornithine cyclodeaminase
VRPIREVAIWNRTRSRAESVVAELARHGMTASVAADLEAAVRGAEIVSVATLSSDPLIHGAWLTPGTHLDCVGAFRPSMRETDDEVVRRARIFVDTRVGAFGEAGDILQPIAAGVIGKDAVLGDLFDLTRSAMKGRVADSDITFFKSVGAAIEDLAAAVAVYEAA